MKCPAFGTTARRALGKDLRHSREPSKGIPVVISVDDEHGPGITGRHGTPVPIAERGHDRIYVLGHIAGAVRSPIRRVSERSGRTPRYRRSSRAVRWRATPWMLPRDPRAADFMKSPIRRHVQAGLERRGSLLRIRYAPRRDRSAEHHAQNHIRMPAGVIRNHPAVIRPSKQDHLIQLATAAHQVRIFHLGCQSHLGCPT